MIKIGETYHWLTIIGPTQDRGLNGAILWECECICSKTIKIEPCRLIQKRNPKRSCGCKAYQRKIDYLAGRKFGRLSPKAHSIRFTNNGYYVRYWHCECDCGNHCIVDAPSLKDGTTKSCGCLHKEFMQEMSKTKYKGYESLTGAHLSSIRATAHKRGIKVEITPEDMWKLFQEQKGLCVLSDVPIQFERPENYEVGDGYQERTASLDRIDSSKGYIEGNVQWVDKKINLMKGNKTDSEFIQICRKVTEHADRKDKRKI